MSESNALRALGLTDDDVRAVVEEMEDRRSGRSMDRSQQICLCGHGTSRHTVFAEGTRVICRPGRTHCRCKRIQPVLRSSNTRFFMARTDGPGRDHALSKGLVKAVLAEARIEWLVEPHCMRPECGAAGPEAGVVPACVGSSGKVMNETADVNVFVCRDCLVKFS